MFLASSEKLEVERRKLQDQEAASKSEDAERLEKIAEQMELIQQLENKKRQLVRYHCTEVFCTVVGHWICKTTVNCLL